ncbi:hypothetical protein MHYP_G00251110 [Metynnis hypsauchen]
MVICIHFHTNSRKRCYQWPNMKPLAELVELNRYRGYGFLGSVFYTGNLLRIFYNSACRPQTTVYLIYSLV